MFPGYDPNEEIIFERIQNYFEKLPPIGNDDHKNAFDDLIAQYGFGGEDYLVGQEVFDNLIEATSLAEFEKFSNETQEKLKQFYGEHFLKSSFDEKDQRYLITNEEFSYQTLPRFKVWMEDNFSSDDLFIDEEDSLDAIPSQICNFLILFINLIEDPELSPLKSGFHSAKLTRDNEMTVWIATNHVKYYMEYDFQLQMEISVENISVWCACSDLLNHKLNYFFYVYHHTGVEEIEGSIENVAQWLNKNFIKSGIREMLDIRIIEKK
jgi:hypothetical protein